MLTLIATIIGIIGNVLPSIIGVWKDYADTTNQVKLLQLQATIAIDKASFDALVAQNAALLADRQDARADAFRASGFPIIDFFNALFRPVLAWTIFVFFILIKCVVIWHMTQVQGMAWGTAVPVVLDTETNQLFYTIFGVYFGGAVAGAVIAKPKIS